MKKKAHTAQDYQKAIDELVQYISPSSCLVNPKTGEKKRGENVKFSKVGSKA